MKRTFYSDNAWKEFCTPHDICHMAAETLYGKMQLTQKKLVSVSDPVCGTGALMTAYIQEFFAKGVSY